MNSEDLKDLEDFDFINNFNNFTCIDDLKKILNIISQFDSYENFYKFMIILKSIPTIAQVNEWTKYDCNLYFFELLKFYGYFKLLDPIQNYNLFITACSHNSIDIAIFILNYTDIDLGKVKEFMTNPLIYNKSIINHIIFKKIWEKNIIHFNLKEIETIFFYILKTSNLEFIKWFCSLNLIDLKNDIIKQKIGDEILERAENISDFAIGLFICSMYSDIYKYNKLI